MHRISTGYSSRSFRSFRSSALICTATTHNTTTPITKQLTIRSSRTPRVFTALSRRTFWTTSPRSNGGTRARTPAPCCYPGESQYRPQSGRGRDNGTSPFWLGPYGATSAQGLTYLNLLTSCCSSASATRSLATACSSS